MRFKKILCPTDFSEASQLAARVGANLAARDRGELQLLHVVEFAPPLPTDPVFVVEVAEYERMIDADAQRRLDELASCFTSVSVRTIVAHGDAGDEIVRIARDEAVDLIVIGTNGKTGLEQVLFRSVAEEVVRRAHRPVLTLPAPAPAPDCDGGVER